MTTLPILLDDVSSLPTHKLPAENGRGPVSPIPGEVPAFVNVLAWPQQWLRAAVAKVVGVGDTLTKTAEFSVAAPKSLPAGFSTLDDFLLEFDADSRFQAELTGARKWVAEKYYADAPTQLKALRLSKGLSQTVVANRIGTSQARLSRIENGKEEPGLSTLRSLANVLETDLNTIGAAIRLESDTQ